MTEPERQVHLSCDAPHPARHRFDRFQGQTHRARLPVSLPPWLGLVHVRQLEDLDEVRPGYLGIQCTHRDCGVVHEFRIELRAPGRSRTE